MPRTLVLFFLALYAPSAMADEATWHLLTKSHDGTVSLVKNLTEHECQLARLYVLWSPSTPDEEIAENKRHPPGSTWIITSTQSDIETAECFK